MPTVVSAVSWFICKSAVGAAVPIPTLPSGASIMSASAPSGSTVVIVSKPSAAILKVA